MKLIDSLCVHYVQLSLPEPRRLPSSSSANLFPLELPLPLAASGSPAPTLGSQGRAVLCRGRAGETRRFKDCLHGSRTTVVPADRQMCLVDRDCQVVWGDRDCQVVRGDSDCKVVWGDRDCQVAGVAGAVR